MGFCGKSDTKRPLARQTPRSPLRSVPAAERLLSRHTPELSHLTSSRDEGTVGAPHRRVDGPGVVAERCETLAGALLPQLQGARQKENGRTLGPRHKVHRAHRKPGGHRHATTSRRFAAPPVATSTAALPAVRDPRTLTVRSSEAVRTRSLSPDGDHRAEKTGPAPQGRGRGSRTTIVALPPAGE
jgi:hypothetical protein